jgi:methionyl-tRNA formyltransferase
MDSSRVIVFGYGELGAAAIEVLAGAGADVGALVLPSNRSSPDVDLARSFAEGRGLAVIVQPPRKQIEPFVARLRDLDPDLILVWSYSMILPAPVLGVPRGGCVNLHGGLLPHYRGGHVMQWAIINGEAETGVTLHYMDEGVDTGPVVAEHRFRIEPEDDAASIRLKLRDAGVRLIGEWLPRLLAGTAPRVPQDETCARYYRLRTAEDGLIDWSAPSAEINNLVRALVSPWPGAFTFRGGQRIIVRRASQATPANGGRLAPGTVCAVEDEGVCVATGDGEIIIREAEVGGRVTGGREMKALGFRVGEVLGR